MSVHQTIYEMRGKTAEEILEVVGGGNPQSIRDRVSKIETFLEDHEWNEQDYLTWLRGEVRAPSLTTMAVNVAHSAAHAMHNGFKRATPEERRRRLAICQECEFKFPHEDRCGKCGCLLKGKVQLEAWNCPIDRW
jgi:hypothetical protein